jgi:hypothetical protein
MSVIFLNYYTKHKGIHYRTSAVHYYLNNNESMDKVCKKTTLKVWLHNYQNNKNLTRRNRKHIYYKVKKEQMKSALDMIDKN